MDTLKVKNRNTLIGVRATIDFTKKFDELCSRLGQNRSNVVRYALNSFIRNNWNNTENFTRAREEMY
jgi:hypothetical protein